MVAETLPDDPFDPVADHCTLGALSRDYQTESRVASPIIPRKDRQIPIRKAIRIREDELIFARLLKPVLLGKAPLGSGQRDASGYALSRWRPLARRRFSTMRPEAVCMRERKPCRRLRLMTLG